MSDCASFSENWTKCMWLSVILDKPLQFAQANWMTISAKTGFRPAETFYKGKN